MFREEDIVSLLVDDEELEAQLKQVAAECSAKQADLNKKRQQQKKKGGGGGGRLKMGDDGEGAVATTGPDSEAAA